MILYCFIEKSANQKTGKPISSGVARMSHWLCWPLCFLWHIVWYSYAMLSCGMLCNLSRFTCICSLFRNTSDSWDITRKRCITSMFLLTICVSVVTFYWKSSFHATFLPTLNIFYTMPQYSALLFNTVGFQRKTWKNWFLELFSSSLCFLLISIVSMLFNFTVLYVLFGLLAFFPSQRVNQCGCCFFVRLQLKQPYPWTEPSWTGDPCLFRPLWTKLKTQHNSRLV